MNQPRDIYRMSYDQDSDTMSVDDSQIIGFTALPDGKVGYINTADGSFYAGATVRSHMQLVRLNDGE